MRVPRLILVGPDLHADVLKLQAAHENLAPAVVASLTRQLRQLSNAPPEGVRLCPNDSGSLSEVYAELDGPVETPYVGGLFKLKLVLGPEYPAVPPKGV